MKMAVEYSDSQLDSMSKDELKFVIRTLQTQFKELNSNMETLIEQLRISNQQRFGRHSETLDVIDGQLGFFNDIEVVYEENTPEPSMDEVIEKKRSQRSRDNERSILPDSKKKSSRIH